MWSHIQCQKSQIPLSTLSVIVSCLSETTSVSYHINDYHINEGSAVSNCACEQWLDQLNGIQPSWLSYVRTLSELNLNLKLLN